MPSRPASIKVRALQWLSQREHSRIELRDKLLSLYRSDAKPLADTAPADPAAEVEALLLWLEARGYLSPQRFVESRVHLRQARFGTLRIQQELQQHGLRLDEDARQALQQTELQRAGRVWRKKYAAPAADAAGRLRQMRFLAGRGFAMDVVRQVLRGAACTDGEIEPGPDES